MDQDYVGKLSEEEKRWLSNFNEEYMSGNFQHPGKILHKTKKKKRECYNNNNARNRDVISLMKSQGTVTELHDGLNDAMSIKATHNHEDTLLELIDLKNKLTAPKKKR